MNSQIDLLTTLEWAQDPMQTCAGQCVILSSSFEDLAQAIQVFPEVRLTPEQCVYMFNEESKRFSACGANPGVNNRFAVLRKNPSTGWEYLIKKLETAVEIPAVDIPPTDDNTTENETFQYNLNFNL